jgi:DNA repair protein SbcD/Mre11
MRFAHLADCHIGSWREPKLSELNTRAFIKSIDICLEKEVDFILISGDLFNTSLPSIDKLKTVVKELRRIKDTRIPVYCIAGSHDFSPSGKTMIEVLESAGLCINVSKGAVEDGKLLLRFTVDRKTGVKITGIPGRKGMLEKSYYEDLDRESLENEPGTKIFLFHTAITELKQQGMEKMDSAPASYLPNGFDYYAGGHVHVLQDECIDGKRIVFPGPLFPNNFKELEEQQGGFIIHDGKPEFQPVSVCNVARHSFDCDGKTKEEIEDLLLQATVRNEYFNTIVTVRLHGKMSGKPADLDFRKIYSRFYEKGAYFVMKNSSGLTSPEFEEIKVAGIENADELEEKLIKEHLGQIPGVSKEREEEVTKALLQALSKERQEGERLQDYSSSMITAAEAIVKGIKHQELS